MIRKKRGAPWRVIRKTRGFLGAGDVKKLRNTDYAQVVAGMSEAQKVEVA